jgi:glucose-6-phosphate isomerase
MNNEVKVNPFTIYFDLLTGKGNDIETSKRFLSNMKGMFADDKAYDEMLLQENSMIYEFYEMYMPETSGDLQFGTSITYPGKVGNEYFMTKGHFHSILDTAETYYCLQGNGYLLMEDPEGNWDTQELTPGKMVYVPKRWAHRSINVGNVPFITFFVFRGDAGHDYGTIETKGFRKLIAEINGKVQIIDNPKWK